ncbi:MAG: acetate--CoA ligase family protein, partial [Acidimicrobiia bacterium]|nr:acetate--CoA ligase family protein [Acidimicrobiia bacterium]
MAVDRLARLLDPRSVAFVGGRRAALAVQQTERLGYAGKIWVVNPSGSPVAGRLPYASLADLPEPPDAVFIGVGADQTVEIVARAAELGAGGVVAYAAGFAEWGELGAQRQHRLVDVCGVMPVIGPNCHGFVNAMSGAALWPDVHGCERVERGVAIVTQSGNVAMDLTMQQRGLPVAYAITLGNQAVVSIAACITALIADTRVSAIGLHVEGIGDSAAFAAAALAAAEAEIPIVALKSGTTQRGAAIAATHTASLAGSAAAHRAMFARYGIGQVDSAEHLLGALTLLHHHGRLGGNRLVSLSCSGGEASLIADQASSFTVDFPAFPEASRDRIDSLLEQRVAVSNPLDYHTFIWGDRARMTAVFTEALAAPVDAGILVIDFPAPGLDATDWWPTVDAFADAVKQTGAPGIVTSTLPENLPEPVCRRLRDDGLAAIPGIPAALASVAAASTAEPRMIQPHAVLVGVTGGTMIDEATAKTWLRGHGLPLPPGRAAAAADVAASAREVGFPVAVKSLEVEHRSDVGGVALALADSDQVSAAVTSMRRIGKRFYVERHIENVVAELLVGIHHDEPVGWTLTIGAGGVLAELIRDT